MAENRAEIFGYPIYLGTQNDLISEIGHAVQTNNKIELLSMNTLKLYLGSKNNSLESTFKKASHIIPDGQSIVFALQLLKKKKIPAISGAELMLELISFANSAHHSIFFLGSPQVLLDKVKVKIDSEYSGLSKVGYQHGYYDLRDEKEIVKSISEFKPNFLFIAFGSPRKEEFMSKYARELNANIVMGVGGSYEIFVGRKKIDKWSKKIGLRWLIRTLQDPVRLLPRYAKCNTYFLYLFLLEMFKKK
jgi:N-acetylglucosaminyldiphosphoundecaprenol N-acetyl-beta-D-mannosaminyltransferase